MSTQTQKFWEMRSPEIAELDRDQTLVIVPTGAIEQHGLHLPLETDISNSLAIALAVAERGSCNGKSVLVAPPVWWGMSPHHAGFPGTISLRMETMSNLIFDICKSLYTHGFFRIVFLNGHGGNGGVLYATALKVMEEVGVSVAHCSYWHLIREALTEFGDSALGGMGHAGELESSLQLFLQTRTNMSAAKVEMPRKTTSFTSSDFRRPGPVSLPWDFIRDTKFGVLGDPSEATAEKGKKFFDAAVENVGKLVSDMFELSAQDLESAKSIG